MEISPSVLQPLPEASELITCIFHLGAIAGDGSACCLAQTSQKLPASGLCDKHLHVCTAPASRRIGVFVTVASPRLGGSSRMGQHPPSEAGN